MEIAQPWLAEDYNMSFDQYDKVIMPLILNKQKKMNFYFFYKY